MKRISKAAAISAVLALALAGTPEIAQGSTPSDGALTKYTYLKDAGIFSGFDDGTARLDETMTREQFATVLAKLWGMRLDTGGSAAIYEDVPASRWSSPEIAAVTRAGFMNGVADGKFAPEEPVTFQQLAAVMVRAFGFGFGAPGTTPGVTDDWAKPYVAAALSRGLIRTQLDYTKTAARADLVDASYIAYQTLLSMNSGAKPQPGGAVTLVSALAVDAWSIEAVFSDGGKQTIRLTAELVPGKATAVEVPYKDSLYTATVVLPLPERPAPPPDYGDTPVMTEALSLTNTKLKVVFAEPVEAESARADRFRISGSGGKPVPVRSVRLLAEGSYAVLETEAQTVGQLYTVTLGDESRTYTALAADLVKPQLLSAVVNADASITLTFSEPLDSETTVSTLNYQLAGLTVKEAVPSDDGRTVTLYTSTQKDGGPYALTVYRLTDWAGNVIQNVRPMLIRGRVDRQKPVFEVAMNQGDTTVDARFSKQLDRASAENAANFTITESGDHPTAAPLTVWKAHLLPDGKTVRLTVDRQQPGVIYKLTARGVADRSGNTIDETGNLFMGITDTNAPSVKSAVSLPGSAVQLEFDEKVDKRSAEDLSHYRIDGLQVVKATLAPDHTTLKLLTEPQSMGVLYRLTVQGVTDPAGNAAAEQSVSFAGNPDVTPPQAVRVTPLGDKLQLTFSESLDPVRAVDPANYSVGGTAGFALHADYDDLTKTVTLRTIRQTAGAAYRLNLSRVTDRAGNAVSPAAITFTGVDPLSLLSAQAVSSTTVEAVFNRELRTGELSQLTFKVGLASFVSKSLESVEPTVVPTADPAKVRLRFRIPASPLTPLFRSGQSYQLTVTGAPELVADDGSSNAIFAGTNAADPPPAITSVQGITNASVRITFSEPIKNASAASFQVHDNTGRLIPILGEMRSDPAKPVTDIVLLLGSDLQNGPVYQLTVSTGITDATGLIALRLPTTRPPYTMPFASVDSPNLPPKMLAGAALDKYNAIVSFSEPIDGAANARFRLVDGTDGSSIDLFHGVNADFEPTKDRMGVAIHLYATSGLALQDGRLYTLKYDAGSAAIRDLQNTPYDPAPGADAILFAGNGAEPPQLRVVAAQAVGNRLVVTLNNEITPSGVFPYGMLDVNVDGNALMQTNGTIEGRTLTLTYSWSSGKTGTVSMSPSWAAVYRDLNRLTADTSGSFTFVTP